MLADRYFDTYTVSILGKSPVYDELTTYTRNIYINGVPIKIIQIEDVHELKNAQLVFITENMSHTITEVVQKTSGLPLIVVAEREELFKAGADISFVEYDKEAFPVNLNRQTLEKRNVKISKALYNTAHSIL